MIDLDLYKSRCKELKEYGLDNSELNNYKWFEDLYSPCDFKEVLKEKQNRKNKRYRVKRKIYDYILEIATKLKSQGKDPKVVFGTCTLNDKELSNKERTRTKKLDLWIQNHFIYAIVNKDYGKKNEREHYHFIAITTEDLENKKIKSKKGFEIFELKRKNYNLGFEPTLCIVNFEKFSDKQLINYLLKLNNHSTKDTQKARIRVISKPVIKLFKKEPKNAQK